MTTDGSAAAPFTDLKTALENPKLKAGHTIYLLSGTHVLSGNTTASAAGITVRPFRSEAVVIDMYRADLFLNSNGLVLRDVSIISSDPQRISDQTGSAPNDVQTGEITINGPVSLANVRITSTSGVGWWTNSAGTWKGVLIQDIGWDAPDRGHGHALYAQNKASDGTKTLTACILVNGYSYSLHIYGSRNAALSGFTLTDCIVMNDNALIGGESGSSVDSVILKNCAFYAPLRIGYAVSTNGTASLTDSLLRRLTIQQSWQSLTVSGCTMLAGSGVCMQMYAAADYSGLHLDHNVYISSAAAPFQLINGAGTVTFAQWKVATGLDKNSRFYSSVKDAVTAGDLVVPVVRVFAVNEGNHKANIAIWNPNSDATVSVDLSALGLVNGSYQLRQVRDYTGDVRAVTYTGAAVTVSMSGTTAYPPGYPTPYHPEAVPANALPVFGAFELWAV
jgi:hypothetical protein